MSVQQTRAVRRRQIARYGKAHAVRSLTVQESIERERAKAARAARIKRK